MTFYEVGDIARVIERRPWPSYEERPISGIHRCRFEDEGIGLEYRIQLEDLAFQLFPLDHRLLSSQQYRQHLDA